MKFLYKIYSGYDNFTPQRIPVRLYKGKYLKLGWQRYLDAVDLGAECWIYFYGPHAFANGVYVKGFIAGINRDLNNVLLRVREHSVHEPLTDPETTARIAQTVRTRYRQVFLWPDSWDEAPQCSRDTCQKRLCDNCTTWNALPIIDETHVQTPEVEAISVVPAYWIIPHRCYCTRNTERRHPGHARYR